MAKPINWPTTTPWPVTSMDEVTIATMKPDCVIQEDRNLLFTFSEPTKTTIKFSPNWLVSLSFVLKDFENVSWTIHKQTDRHMPSVRRIKEMFAGIDKRYLKYTIELSMVTLHTHLYFLKTEDLLQKLHTQVITDLHTELSSNAWIHNHALLSVFSLLKYDTPIDIVKTIALNCFQCIYCQNYNSLFQTLSRPSTAITNLRLIMEQVHNVDFQSSSNEMTVMAFFDYIKYSNPLVDNVVFERAKLNYANL